MSILEHHVEGILSRMTVEEKIGQLFTVFFNGSAYSEALDFTIRRLHVGGIIIFGHNISSPEGVATMVNAAQTAAADSGAKIPLIVAVDHEGEPVNRFGNKLSQFPGNMAIAATGSPENAKAVARAMAKELKSMGINMNMAPVMDINSNPDNPIIGKRSFGSNPIVVAQFGATIIKEFQANDIIPAAKHFPGHGDTSGDSHSTLPTVVHNRSHLNDVEFLPFRSAIDAGTDAIMTAHVVFPAIDPDYDLPATLSERVLTDLLRGELGFQGLIVTDSLGMGAVKQRFGIADASARAFQAGADLLLFGNDPGHTPAEQYPAYQNLLTLVKKGIISRERLDASVRRILLTKAKRGILGWQPASIPDIKSKILTPEHLVLARSIGEQSVTLLKNERQLLPIKKGQKVLLVYPGSGTRLESVFREYGKSIDAIPVRDDPNGQEIAYVLTLAVKADVIVVATDTVRKYPGQASLVKSLQHLPLVVIALESPYDLLAFPYVAAFMAIYGNTPASVHAAAKVAFGQLRPSGKLPIALPGLFPEGHGL